MVLPVITGLAGARSDPPGAGRKSHNFTSLLTKKRRSQRRAAHSVISMTPPHGLPVGRRLHLFFEPDETDMSRPRAFTARVLRRLPAWIAAAYLLLLCFPAVLFAHELSYRNFTIYSRQPLDKSIYGVLDRVETRLAASQIDGDLKPRIFLTNGFDVYALLSLYIGTNSFGKSYAALPTENVFINKADFAKDLVFRNAPPSERSLSGVIAHEVTHLWMRKRFGYWRYLAIPAWKKEGYAEYVAGGSTLDYQTGLRMWKANPRDSTGYQYFKYYMLVRYLLEHDRLGVDALVDHDFDLQSLEQRVLESL